MRFAQRSVLRLVRIDIDQPVIFVRLLSLTPTIFAARPPCQLLMSLPLLS